MGEGDSKNHDERKHISVCTNHKEGEDVRLTFLLSYFLTTYLFLQRIVEQVYLLF